MSAASAQNNIRQFEPAQSSPWSVQRVIQEKKLDILGGGRIGNRV